MKKKETVKINFLETINELAESKGISSEAVLIALREALVKAYLKSLGGDQPDMPALRIECSINEQDGSIYLANIKKVQNEDDIEDDYLEISVEDANEGLKKPQYKVGDDYADVAPIEEMTKALAMAVKNILRQNLGEAERTALYDIYKDHIGEMITGTVEKTDERSVSVNIGRTVVDLTRREMIGNEWFHVGDPIKVYLEEVRSTAKAEGEKSRGPQIQITRSSEGFLKRLFEEEIHEIFEGTVLIKGIAREAGVRSKVAVYSANEDIDATGACIGQGGSRIQKIVAQLGNSTDKEKIDIINWTANPACYIIEALRPAKVLGVALEPAEEEGQKNQATAIVEDGSLSLAIGKRGANVRLACRLTGWSIDIVEEGKANEEGLSYTLTADWIARADLEKKAAEREAYARRLAEEAAAKAAPAEEKAEEAKVEAPVAPTPAPTPVKPVELPPEAVNPATAALEALRAQEAAKKAAEAKAAEKHVDVTTTTSISDLEKELEAAKEKKVYAKPKKPRTISEKEIKHEEVTTTTVKVEPAVMPIYTQEELDEIAKEEAEALGTSGVDIDEDVDYEDYDSYYDDEN